MYVLRDGFYALETQFGGGIIGEAVAVAFDADLWVVHAHGEVSRVVQHARFLKQSAQINMMVVYGKIPILELNNIIHTAEYIRMFCGQAKPGDDYDGVHEEAAEEGCEEDGQAECG